MLLIKLVTCPCRCRVMCNKKPSCR